MIYKSSSLDEVHDHPDLYIIPDWQREQVWGLSKKQLLIDTILRGWKLPKFYFAQMDNGDGHLEIVDGQQRFLSIQEFMNNKFPLSAATRQELGIALGDYKDLPSDFRRLIQTFAIEYDEISNADPKDKKEFFQRLQQGVPLTNKERLNAVHSGLRNYALSMTKHPFFQSSLAFPNTRFAHLGVAAKVLAAAINGLDSTLRSNEIRATFLTYGNFEAASPLAQHLNATLDFLSRAFPTKSRALNNQTFAQSVITLASQLVAGGQSEGCEADFRQFIERFHAALSEKGRMTDVSSDYLEFRGAANAKGPGEAHTRQRIFIKKMTEWFPQMASRLATNAGASSWGPGAAEIIAAQGATPHKPSVDEEISLDSGKAAGLSMFMVSTDSSVREIVQARERYVIADWQRGEVWGTEKKQLLIDSMMQGWKLPKFYVSHRAVGDEISEVVDGQQRLSAFLGFIDNKFPLARETAEKFNLQENCFFRDLPVALSTAFLDYTIEVDEIYGASPAALKEFFQRLQQGMPLASRERLNAVHSELRDYCVILARHPFFQSAVALSPKRHAFFDIVSKAMAIEIGGIDAVIRFDGIKKLFEATPKFSSESPEAQRLHASLDFLAIAFPTRAIELRHRSITQSIITLASQFVATGRSAGHEGEFARFVKKFLTQYVEEVRRPRDIADRDYLKFRETISADLLKNAKIRHDILHSKMRSIAPGLAALLAPEGDQVPVSEGRPPADPGGDGVGPSPSSGAGAAGADPKFDPARGVEIRARPTSPPNIAVGVDTNFSAQRSNWVSGHAVQLREGNAPEADLNFGAANRGVTGVQTPTTLPPPTPPVSPPLGRRYPTVSSPRTNARPHANTSPPIRSRPAPSPPIKPEFRGAMVPLVAHPPAPQKSAPVRLIAQGTAPLNRSDYARTFLEPLLNVLASLTPPITTFIALSEKLDAMGEGDNFDKVSGVFSGGTPVLIQSGDNRGMVFSRPAVILAEVAGKPSREVYADAIKGRTLKSSPARLTNRSVGRTVTWDDFFRVVPTLAKHLTADREINTIDGLFAFIRPYWSSEDTFHIALEELATSEQPYDPSTARLKPLPSAIAARLNPSIGTEQFFPEYDADHERFSDNAKMRHRALVGLVAKYFVKAEDGATNDAPKFIGREQKIVLISQVFTEHLYRHTAGKNSAQKHPIVRGYLGVLENSAPMMTGGNLTPAAQGLLKLLKVPPSEIADLVAGVYRPGSSPPPSQAPAANGSAPT